MRYSSHNYKKKKKGRFFLSVHHRGFLASVPLLKGSCRGEPKSNIPTREYSPQLHTLELRGLFPFGFNLLPFSLFQGFLHAFIPDIFSNVSSPLLFYVLSRLPPGQANTFPAVVSLSCLSLCFCSHSFSFFLLCLLSYL